MKNTFYKKLHHLYFDLNDVLLQSLKDHAQEESGGKWTLEKLIQAYATTCHHSPLELREITFLKNTKNIADQETFYDYISDMIFYVNQEGKHNHV